MAAQQAALRRQRIANGGAIVVVGLGAIVGLALFAGGGEDDGGSEQKPRREENGNGENGGENGEEPAAAACGAETPPEADPQQYPEPGQVLEDGVDYGAVMTTSCGTVTIDLSKKKRPRRRTTSCSWHKRVSTTA